MLNYLVCLWCFRGSRVVALFISNNYRAYAKNCQSIENVWLRHLEVLYASAVKFNTELRFTLFDWTIQSSKNRMF